MEQLVASIKGRLIVFDAATGEYTVLAKSQAMFGLMR